MTYTPIPGITDLDLELAGIERQLAELFGIQPEPEPQPQTAAPAHSPTQPIYPPPGFQLSEAALYGAPGNVVRTLAPHSGHLSSKLVEAALQQLVSMGAIGQQTQPSRGGRRSTLWTATPNGESHAQAASQAGT